MNPTPSLPVSANELQESVRLSRRLDPARLDRVLRLDEKRALVEVQAHVSWKALAAHLRPGDARARELGTAASVGKTIARNAAGPDGRPVVAHVESLTLVTPGGQLRRVDRVASPALFALVVGGQGLFGVLYSATLRIESLARAVSEAQPIEARPKASLQLFVPPEHVEVFLAEIGSRCREWRMPVEGVQLRYVHREDETVLRWARRDYAEVSVGLGELTTLGGAVRATQLRRELIDAAIALGGSFPIACTPEATRAQAEACYPQLAEFLAEQRRIDPGGLMANAWLRHQRSLLGREACEVRWGA
jgi:hypothetical protein